MPERHTSPKRCPECGALPPEHQLVHERHPEAPDDWESTSRPCPRVPKAS